MTGLIKFDLLLLVTALGSTLIYGIWKGFSFIAVRFSMTLSVYRALQFAILSFFLPVTYLAICLPHMSFDGSWEGKFLGMTPVISSLAVGVFAVWVVGAVCQLPKILQSICEEREFRRRHLPCGGREDEIVRELSRQMGIHRKITVHKGEFSAVPALGGVWHPHIYMNKDTESEENLRIIFRHELTHYQHQDVAVKWALNIFTVIYWFHPLFFRGILLRDYTKWSEYACDASVCREMPFREYGLVLYALAEKVSDRIVRTNCGCMVCEEEKEIIRRLKRMKVGQKEKKVPRVIAAMLTGAVILGSSAAAYGAGLGIEAGYNVMYKMSVREYEEPYVESEKMSLTEYTMNAEEAAAENVVIEEEESITSASNGSINWNVKGGARKATSGFSMKKGQSIEITVYMDPEDINVWVGIIEPNGDLRYVSVTKKASHVFEIKKSGTHKVFVENRESSTVAVVGVYSGSE